jgi:hypothetical protein
VFSINSVKIDTRRLMEDFGDSEYDVEAVANEAIASILPKESSPQYEKAYTDFRHWCDSKKMSNTTENVLLAYIFRGKVEDFEVVNTVVPFF